MKNEQTKKEYSTPKMELVELKHETNLLVCSDGSEGVPGCPGELN